MHLPDLMDLESFLKSESSFEQLQEKHRCSTPEDYWQEITFQSIFKDDVIESSGRWNFVTGEIQIHEWNKDLPRREKPVEEMFHDLDHGGYSRVVCPCCHKSSMKTDIGEWAVDIKHEYAACANPECAMHGKNIGAKL